MKKLLKQLSPVSRIVLGASILCWLTIMATVGEKKSNKARKTGEVLTEKALSEHLRDSPSMPPPQSSPKKDAMSTRTSGTRAKKMKCFRCDSSTCVEHQRTHQWGFKEDGAWDAEFGKRMKDTNFCAAFDKAHEIRMKKQIEDVEFLIGPPHQVTTGERIKLQVVESYVGLTKAQIVAKLSEDSEPSAKELKLCNLPAVMGGNYKGRAFPHPDEPYVRYNVIREFDVSKEEFLMSHQMQLSEAQPNKVHQAHTKKFEKTTLRNIAHGQALNDYIQRLGEKLAMDDDASGGEESSDDDMDDDGRGDGGNDGKDTDVASTVAPGSPAASQASGRSKASRSRREAQLVVGNQKMQRTQKKLDELLPENRLLGKHEGVPIRWAEDLRQEFLAEDSKCVYAGMLGEKLDVMTAAGECTAKKISTSNDKKKRKENLKILHDDGVTLPQVCQEALVERDIKDTLDDPELRAKCGSESWVHDCLELASPYDINVSEEKPAVPSSGFDMTNPRYWEADGTAAEKSAKFTHFVCGMMCPAILDVASAHPEAANTCTNLIENTLASVDFSTAEEYVECNTEMLQPIRCVCAVLDPTRLDFYDDVKQCNSAYIASKKKQAITNPNFVVMQAIIDRPELHKTFKLLLSSLEVTSRNKDVAEKVFVGQSEKNLSLEKLHNMATEFISLKAKGMNEVFMQQVMSHLRSRISELIGNGEDNYADFFARVLPAEADCTTLISKSKDIENFCLDIVRVVPELAKEMGAISASAIDRHKRSVSAKELQDSTDKLSGSKDFLHVSVIRECIDVVNSVVGKDACSEVKTKVVALRAQAEELLIGMASFNTDHAIALLEFCDSVESVDPTPDDVPNFLPLAQKVHDVEVGIQKYLQGSTDEKQACAADIDHESLKTLFEANKSMSHLYQVFNSKGGGVDAPWVSRCTENDKHVCQLAQEAVRQVKDGLLDLRNNVGLPNLKGGDTNGNIWKDGVSGNTFKDYLEHAEKKEFLKGKFCDLKDGCEKVREPSAKLRDLGTLFGVDHSTLLQTVGEEISLALATVHEALILNDLKKLATPKECAGARVRLNKLKTHLQKPENASVLEKIAPVIFQEVVDQTTLKKSKVGAKASATA